MTFFRDILDQLHKESTRLYVSGPRSDTYKRGLTDLLKEALKQHDLYQRAASQEDRIGF